MRTDGRKPAEMRAVKVTKDYTRYAEGCCLIEFGQTRVLCTASVEENVPPFLKNTGKGWVTAEYGMLPRSCSTRIKRNITSGRTYEIQRLIGRSLRAVADQARLGERTVKVDCDVLQADGGTRTASVTGGFIALALALKHLHKKGMLPGIPLTDYVAAVSVGIVNGQVLLDLDYSEDSNAQMDMNVVMVGRGQFVELQGTAEGRPFAKAEADKAVGLACKGIKALFEVQKKCLGRLNI